MGKVKARAGALSQAEREDRIHRALAKRAELNTPWSVLSLEFGIPSSTLHDRFRGRKNRYEAHQNQQKLPPAIENALKKWCQDMDDTGFPPRVDLLRGMATALAQNVAEEDNCGPDSDAAYIGRNWISRFLNRHPDLASKYSNQIDRQRQNANNSITLRDYFSKLTRLLRELISLGLEPDNDIYNFDEKGFILGYSSKAKVICRRGRRNPNVAQDGSRELITVVEAVCTAGKTIPSWIIYKGKGHYMGWHTATDDPEAVFAYSENGWTDDGIGLKWLQHFNIHSARLSNGRPRLLIMDGHGSHLTYDFCNYALKHKIYLMCLPAHSTHLLQPLDVGLFSPLQHYYGKAADNHFRETRTGITKSLFWTFFNEAKSRSYTKESIKAAFHATGIHPLNPNKVLTKLNPPKKQSPVLYGPKVLQNKHLQTPKNRRELRQQTQFALKQPDNFNSIVLRLSHLAEASLSEAEILKIQIRQLRLKYQGKKAVKADRRVLSKAQVITGAEVMRLKKIVEKKERDKFLKNSNRSKSKKQPKRPHKSENIPEISTGISIPHNIVKRSKKPESAQSPSPLLPRF